ncbi:MAG: hypothetical protein R3D84_06735 [Paracoccaceae bacterium]
MKLAVLVTEYPKTTETFILRDLMTFIDAGVDLRLYHITPFRKAEILHDFARPTRARARHIPLAGAAALRALGRHPGLGARHGATIVRRLWAEPLILAKSLAMVPQSLALADELADWGAEHIHAEFAGHPATAAWIANAVTGIPYSVSCRAHDIFRTQRLLREKLGMAAAVRTVSDFARRFVLERVAGLDPAAVSVIHSSVDTAALRPLGPPPAAPFHILYVGSLQPRKGVDILLDALAGLDVPNWRATIAGDGPIAARWKRSLKKEACPVG